MKTKKKKEKPKIDFLKHHPEIEKKKTKTFSVTDTEYQYMLDTAELNDMSLSRLFYLLVNDKEFRTKKFISK